MLYNSERIAKLTRPGDSLLFRKENDYLSKNCEGMSAELRSLKLTEQAQRATIRDLTATVDELTKSLQAKELELAKLQHRVEVYA